MATSHPTTEQTELAERIFQSLKHAAEADLRAPADPPASKADHQLLGHTEFEVRDRVHKIGARVLETARDERNQGGTTAPA